VSLYDDDVIFLDTMCMLGMVHSVRACVRAHIYIYILRNMSACFVFCLRQETGNWHVLTGKLHTHVLVLGRGRLWNTNTSLGLVGFELVIPVFGRS
jgi:hypothetical protein